MPETEMTPEDRRSDFIGRVIGVVEMHEESWISGSVALARLHELVTEYKKAVEGK